MDEETIIGEIQPEKKKCRKKTRITIIAVMLLVLVLAVVYFLTRKPTLAKREFTFAYGETIPTNSSAYFQHGKNYEDVDFDEASFTMSELGTYPVHVTYYDKEYEFTIKIVDEEAPQITFSEEDPIQVYEINGERQTASIFSIADISPYTYEISPAENELHSGEQEICITATDEFENSNTACKTLNLEIVAYTLHADVAAKNVEELLQTFLQEKKLSQSTFGFFFYSPVDGEEYLYNEDTLFNAASTIKVPLNMLYYDRLISGEIKENTTYVLKSSDVEEGDGETLIKYKLNQSIPLDFLQRQSIVNSDNTATNMLIRGLGGFSTFRKLLCTFDEQTYPSRFYTENVVNMHYMLQVMKHLYENQDTYGTLIENMKQASEGLYLQKSSDDFEIAQKYGLYASNLHSIGIVYTPKPYIVGIYTDNVLNSEDIIVELNEWLIAYQLQKF